MPTYEYLCQKCSHRFETWQKMTDEPLTICPECGGHIRRVLYPTGIIFKGSGFYITDHRNGNGSSSVNGSHDGAKKAEGSSETPKTGENKSSDTSTAGASASESTTSSAA
jgi:putative FmdB family regulatory protein